MRLPAAASSRLPAAASSRRPALVSSPVAVTAASSPGPVTCFRDGGSVVGVRLLGVRVTAYTVINLTEHRRRAAAGMGAVTSPALLDRLLDLPAAVPVDDPVLWAETADQPRGILERGEDGASVTRRLESPLTVADVVVQAASGRELRAVQDASLFAGFTRRWVAAARGRVPDATMLEAKLCGVGVLDPVHRVLLAAEKPVALTRDGWSWLLEEKAYGRWLSRRPAVRGMPNPGPATGGARV
jgi:hypothetical protein